MNRRSASWLAWSGWTLSLTALLATFGYRLTGRTVAGLGDQPGSVYPGIAVIFFILAFATVGAVLASKRPSNPIGWLLLASGLSDSLGVFSILLGQFTTRWGDWLSNWVWGLGIAIPATFVLLLFPTGTLPSRRWRPVAWLGGITLALTTISNAFVPGVIQGTHSVNPMGIGGPFGPVLRSLRGAFVLVLVAGLASLASLVFRFRRADPVEREQLKWLVYVGGLLVAAVIAGIVVVGALGTNDFTNNIQNAVIAATFAFVPLAIGFAVLKYRLYDIDVVINKTVVYGLLAGFITAVYVAIVVGLGALIGAGSSKPNLGLSILATAVVAVAFQPVRDRVQRLANRLVYGERATPYQVLSDFAKRMAGTLEAEEQLPRLARALADGTAASTTSVWLAARDELRPAASWPQAGFAGMPVALSDPPAIPGQTLTLPVRHQGVLLGALSLAKAPGDRLTPTEEKLAGDLAGQAGLVFRNVRLTRELLDRLDELQLSRQRLVAAQDEERRRIERNIHDGAQQQLVALAVKVRLARSLAAKDRDRAASMVVELGEGLTGALEELRDLARGIYPPLLADEGLVPALRAQARKSPVPVSVEVEAGSIGRHSQEEEAAVYFCALEALQNVAKYAGASRAVIRLAERDGHLAFEVEDDGVGFDTAAVSYGTGLQGMADRLAALGGELEVRSEPGRGTAVIGLVPLRTLEPVA
jgi:signal transduction histidine kinase